MVVFFFFFQMGTGVFNAFSLFGEPHICVLYSSKPTGEKQVCLTPHHTSMKKPFPDLAALRVGCDVHLGSLPMAEDQSWFTCTHQYPPFQMAAPTAGGGTEGTLIAMLFPVTAWRSLKAE